MFILANQNRIIFKLFFNFLALIFKTDNTEAKLLQLEEFAELDVVLAAEAKK